MVFRSDNVIIGGDLNFMMRRQRVYGKDGNPNSLRNFFIHKFKNVSLYDMKTMKLTPCARTIYQGMSPS